MCVGEAALEVPPSPKVQAYVVMCPSGSAVPVLSKEQPRSVHDGANTADGDWLPSPAFHTSRMGAAVALLASGASPKPSSIVRSTL